MASAIHFKKLNCYGNTSYYFGEGGERVAKKDPAGNIFYYHLDHLDGVNAVTDSSGTLVSRTDYLPFGDIRTGSSGSEKYSYTGKEKDKTDLYYFEARYNSPEFRHFTQADIAEPDYADPQDLNRYSYVGNNPLSYVDYDGFKKKKKAKAQLKAGTKYTTVAKSATQTVSIEKSNSASGGAIKTVSSREEEYSLGVGDKWKTLQKKNGVSGIRASDFANVFILSAEGEIAAQAIGYSLLYVGATELGLAMIGSTGIGIVIVSTGAAMVGVIEDIQEHTCGPFLVSGGSCSDLNDPNIKIYGPFVKGLK